MKKKSLLLDLVIGAVMKLDPVNGERQNLLAFVQSCYCCVVRTYDLNWAQASLAKLTEEEQHALIVWTVLEFETSLKAGVSHKAA